MTPAARIRTVDDRAAPYVLSDPQLTRRVRGLTARCYNLIPSSRRKDESLADGILDGIRQSLI